MWNVKFFIWSDIVSERFVLIETLWNVKTILVDDATMVFGINRNIVECKAEMSDMSKDAECRVLIETLWNVKKEKPSPENDPEMVLIETLWNVKTKAPAINIAPKTVLIETLWNVKSRIFHVLLNRHRVLIETLWNVKWFASQADMLAEEY